MSQNVSPTMNKIELDAVPAESGAANETARETAGTAVMNPDFHPDTFRVEHYAERLIDEVFLNVDHLLKTGDPLVEEPLAAEPEARFATDTGAAAANPAWAEPVPGNPVSFTVLPQSAAPLSRLSPDAEVAPETELTPRVLPKPDWSLRILAGLALASLVGAIAVVSTQWQTYRMLYLQLAGPAVTKTVAAAPGAAPLSPNEQFAGYVQRSLDVLKDQTALNQTTGQMAIASPPALLQVPPAAIQPAIGPTLPVTPIAPMAPPATAPGTIIERIYIPVYQTPNGYVPVDPNTKISPEVAAAGVVRTNPQPSRPSASPSVSPSASPSASSPGSKSGVPSTAVAAETQTSQPQPAPVTAVPGAIVAPAAPVVVEHTLVGLLELGNSSAALFEVGGVTRRLSLGERVGGWTIAEIKNGEATLRKDGQVRTVFVGQTF